MLLQSQRQSTPCQRAGSSNMCVAGAWPLRRAGAAARPANASARRRARVVRTAQTLTDAPTAPRHAPGSDGRPEQAALSPSTAAGSEDGVFSWTKAWYPAMCIDNLDVDKPNKFTLLGKDYIAWCDSKGAWHCFLDRCPHRMATLSDGFIDKARDQVVCAYHGWRFEASGACALIPQALDAQAAATACSSARSCAAAFPTRAAGGLLWVFPDDGPGAAAAAEAASLPLLPQLVDDRVAPMKGRWFERDLPYSWDFFIENVLDPTHVDFAHHGVAGYDANKAPKLDLRLVEDRGPSGFVFQTLPADPSRRGIYGTFTPPSCVTLTPGPDPQVAPAGAKASGPGDVRPGSENPDVLTTLVFYAYPTKPGWARFYGTSWVTDRNGDPLKSFSLFATAMPPWLKHILGFEFLAGDDFFLGAAAKAYVAEGSDWRKSYFLPTRADLAITKMRQWLEKFAGGRIPFPKHMQDEATLFRNLDLTRRQAMDRYSQHVQHCSECKAALARTQAVAASAAIAAVAAVVGACVVASVRAAAALTPGAVPGWLLGMASWGFGGSGSVLGLAGPLLLLGLAAAGVHVLASKLEGLFHYREFVRPTF